MADKVNIEIGGDTTEAKASIKDLEQSTKKSFEKMAVEAEESSKDVSKAFKSAGIRTEKAIRESSAKAKRDFKKIRDSGVASANDIKRAHNAMTAKLKKNSRELSTSSTGLRKIFDRIKVSIIAASAAAVGFFGIKSLSESIKLESALIELQKVLGDTEGKASDFTDQAIEMSKRFGEGADVVILGAATFKRAGFTIQEAFLLQEKALTLVKVSELEAAEATELLIATLKGFKAPASEAARLINVLNTTSNKYATDLRQLAIGMAEFSPIAKKMGLSFEETAGLLTPVIEVFRSGSEASQALRTGLLKLIDDSGPVREAFQKLGISQTDLNKDMRSGKEILGDVSERFNTLAENQKLVITQQLSGIRQTAKMVEVFDGLALSTEITNNALADTNSISKELAIALASTEEKGKRAGQSFTNMARNIGNLLLPVWNLLLDIAIPTMDAIANGIRGMSQAIRTIPDIASFLTNPFRILGNVFKKNKDVIKDVTKETKDLNEATKQQEESIEKVTVALIDVNQIRKEETSLIEKNRDTTIKAFEATGKLQKAQNESLRNAIQETRRQLRELESEADRAAKFSQRILDEIAGSQKRIAQAEFDPLEKLVDDLERAEDDFKKAAKERAAGNIDLARELTLSAVRAANAILEVQKNAVDESEVTTGQLNRASIQAERLVESAQRFAEAMRTSAEEAIPLAEERLQSLESQLALGKATLTGIKDSISEAKKLAVELKALLSQDTTATHTQTINTIKTGGGDNVPGFSTGVKLPGYGGGDKILARLEAGERVIKKEAVRNLEGLGSRAMNALHKGDIKGLVDSLPAYQEGGKVVSPEGSGKTTTVNLNLGDKSFPMKASERVADSFENEIKSINVVKGRKRNVY